MTAPLAERPSGDCGAGAHHTCKFASFPDLPQCPCPCHQPKVTAPCLCTNADDVCPFRGPSGAPQCEEPASRTAPRVHYLVQFDSWRGYVVEKHTVEDVFVTSDPTKADAYLVAVGAVARG